MVVGRHRPSDRLLQEDREFAMTNRESGLEVKLDGSKYSVSGACPGSIFPDPEQIVTHRADDPLSVKGALYLTFYQFFTFGAINFLYGFPF
jgi:hypothetical protein